MGVTTIVPETLALDTVTSDLADGSDDIGTLIVTGADYGNVDVGSRTDNLLLIITDVTGAADNVTIKAGDNPPALRAGLGDLVITVSAHDVLAIVIEAARYMQDDGTINILSAGNNTTNIEAFILPNSV